jgi:ribosome-binding factor A
MAQGPYRRSVRVQESIRRALSEVVARGLPDAPPAFITLSDVQVSDDLRHARLFFSVFSDDDAIIERTGEVLEAQRGYLRHQLAQSVPMKYVPAIHICFDPTVAKATQMSRDLGELVKRADARDTEG